MNAVVEASKEPQGFVVKFSDGAFQTFRYILTGTGRFMVVNPFGDARIAPEFDTMDQAMAAAEDTVTTNRRAQ